MKKFSKKSSAVCLAMVVVALLGVPGQTDAIPPFKKAFEKKYADVLQDEDFKKTFRKANCNVCHFKGKKKDVHNVYGVKLAELIDGRAKERLDAAKEIGDEQVKEETDKLVSELNDALVKVEVMEYKDGQTFGQIINSRVLPVPLAEQQAEDDAAAGNGASD